MATKKVDMIFSPNAPHFVGNGFRVHNFIPSISFLSMQRMNPFILMDYNSKFFFEPSVEPRGVGVHPHRGFETVTIAYKGKIEHRDNSGGGGVIGEGDVQWMTAGSGVLHKEFHEKEWSKKGGEFQMVQLWVNLPSKEKKNPPKYQSIQNNDIPRFYLENNSGEIEVIAGKYNGTAGVAQTHTPLHLYNAKLKRNAEVTFNFPENYNTALLVIEGDIHINNAEQASNDHFVLMANKGREFAIKAHADSIILVLSGEPIHEPIVAQGPFVMNSRQEIIQAYEDFRSGKFGAL